MRLDRAFHAGFLALCIFGTLQATNWRHSKAVDEYVQNLIDCKRIPGLSLAVVKDGKTLVSKGYGYADLETKRPATHETRFCVASLTKAFTATLLAELLHQKGLDWDTPIRSILGPKFYIHDDYRSQQMSLRDVLSQKTGFRAYDGMWMASSMTPDDLLKHLAFLEEDAPFRSKFTYSNIMLILAGVVAEKLGGASWWDLVKQRILIPLNMTRTTFAGEADEGREFAKSYRTDEEGNIVARPWVAVRQIASTYSAASICTTSDDITKWVRFHLRGHDEVPYRELLKETYRPHTVLPEDWNSFFARPYLPLGVYNDYGMGWFTGRYRGYIMLYHYGLMYDYFTRLNLVPYHNLAVFSSINGPANPGVMSWYTMVVNYYVMDLLLQEGPISTPGKICNYDPLNISSMHSAGIADYGGGGVIARPFYLRDLKQYVGTFGNNIMGNVTLYINITTYTLHAQYGKYGRLLLDLYSDEEFSIESELDWTLFCQGFENFGRFTLRKDGTVESVSLPCLEDEHRPPIFYRDHRLPVVASQAEDRSQPHVACVQSSANSRDSTETKIAEQVDNLDKMKTT